MKKQKTSIENQFKIGKTLIGKCFINKRFQEMIKCIFITGTENINGDCFLKTLDITYSIKDGEVYLACAETGTWGYESILTKNFYGFCEIDMDVFTKHYNVVQNKIFSYLKQG